MESKRGSPHGDNASGKQKHRVTYKPEHFLIQEIKTLMQQANLYINTWIPQNLPHKSSLKDKVRDFNFYSWSSKIHVLDHQNSNLDKKKGCHLVLRCS